MQKVDMHYIEYENDGKPVDSWSKDNDDPIPDDALGSPQNLENIQTTGRTTTNGKVTYTRKLDTGDTNYDYKLVDGSNLLNGAWGPGNMGEHGSYIFISTINIDTKAQTVTFGRRAPWEIFEAHGISLIISWTLLSLIGYVSGRLLRHLPSFIWIHRLSVGIGGFATILLAIWAWLESKSNF